MALHWSWDERCGEATFIMSHEGEEDQEITTTLYTGNCCLIFLDEKEDSYQLFTFWADEKHMKSCLGLDKEDPNNIYQTPYCTMTKIKLYRKKCRYFHKIITAIAKAFDHIVIEVYDI